MFTNSLLADDIPGTPTKRHFDQPARCETDYLGVEQLGVVHRLEEQDRIQSS